MRIISWHTAVAHEVDVLRRLMAHADIIVHLRKPNIAEMDFAKLLHAFDEDERQRLVVHQHHKLALDLGVKQLHSASGLREAHLHDPQISKVLFSTSTHSWTEFNSLDRIYKAAFLSPVFPSISKVDYGADKQTPLRGRTNGEAELIALGGIDRKRVAELADSDFDDFALYGAVWQATDPFAEAMACYAQAQALLNNK